MKDESFTRYRKGMVIKMKLVTFNIRCDYMQDGINNFSNRKALILNKISREQPDIICFQEVLPHVNKWLKENLSDYYVIGCGRDERLEDEHTTIAYKKMKFNLFGMEVFWLSETPHVPASRYENQSICPRICTQALFQDVETKELFRVYNTHLDHSGSEARRLGLEQILNKIEEDKKTFLANVSVILTGDFNAFPEDKEMEVLKEYPCLIDTTKEITGTYHEYGQIKPLEKIDYIFVQDSYECGSVTLWDDCVDGIFLSDHYPVCVEISTKY